MNSGNAAAGPPKPLLVAGGAVAAVALALLLARFREERAPRDVTSSRDAGAPATDARARIVELRDARTSVVMDSATDAATEPDAPTEEDAGRFEVDFAAPPWILEHRTVDRGVGICGGMESTSYPRLRVALDGGAAAYDLPSIDDDCPHGVSRMTTTHETFDFDGDGVAELIWVNEIVAPDGASRRESSLWTLRAGAIAPYAPNDAATPGAFVETKDVDGDGRPDLVSRLGYDDVPGIGYSPSLGAFAVAPIFLFHSLPSGVFSRSDAVAKAYTEDTCGTDALEDVIEAGGDMATAVACARVHGKSASEVERVLKKSCASFSSTSWSAEQDDAGRASACPAVLLEIAKHPVPSR